MRAVELDNKHWKGLQAEQVLNIQQPSSAANQLLTWDIGMQLPTHLFAGVTAPGADCGGASSVCLSSPSWQLVQQVAYLQAPLLSTVRLLISFSCTDVYFIEVGTQ